MDHIRDLSVLKELRHFSAADNKLHSMGVSKVVFSYQFVTSLVFSHCDTVLPCSGSAAKNIVL